MSKSKLYQSYIRSLDSQKSPKKFGKIRFLVLCNMSVRGEKQKHLVNSTRECLLTPLEKYHIQLMGSQNNFTLFCNGWRISKLIHHYM